MYSLLGFIRHLSVIQALCLYRNNCKNLGESGESFGLTGRISKMNDIKSISKPDWDKTPNSVKGLVKRLVITLQAVTTNES